MKPVGLGTAALTEVRACCANRGARAIFVRTGWDKAAALALYRRVGFVDTDRQLLSLPQAEPARVLYQNETSTGVGSVKADRDTPLDLSRGAHTLMLDTA